MCPAARLSRPPLAFPSRRPVPHLLSKLMSDQRNNATTIKLVIPNFSIADWDDLSPLLTILRMDRTISVH